MKITIQVMTDKGISYADIDGSMPFEMHGLRFAAHRRYSPGIPDKILEWRVSETSTGMGVSHF